MRFIFRMITTQLRRLERGNTVEIKKLEGAVEAILFTMGESVELERIGNMSLVK